MESKKGGDGMPTTRNGYTVEVKPSHLDWGEYRNPTNRDFVEGESYVKIPSDAARRFDIIRGNEYIAHFSNSADSFRIKAAGNGPEEGNVQYAKQFEGIGPGACKAFTPWYQSEGIQVGDEIRVEFLSDNEILFSKM